MTAHKAWVALIISAILAGITAALGLAAPGTPIFIGLTIAVATITPIATALGVYQTANRPKQE